MSNESNEREIGASTPEGGLAAEGACRLPTLLCSGSKGVLLLLCDHPAARLDNVRCNLSHLWRCVGARQPTATGFAPTSAGLAASLSLALA